MASISSSRRLRSQRRALPWDVLLLVFQECDPSTLATLGRVSLDFLAATSSRLYGVIEIRSVKALEKLFCERLEQSKVETSRINTHLTLSRIRSLDLDFASTRQRFPFPLTLKISVSRAVTQPIPLQLLRVSVVHSNSRLFTYLSSFLLPHLNPVRVAYDFPRRRHTTSVWMWSSAEPPLDGWTRLEQISFDGALLAQSLGPATLARLPPPTRDRRRTLRLDVPSLLGDATSPTCAGFPKWIGGHSQLFGLDEMLEGSIFLVVDSEKQKREVEEGIAADMVETWKPIFVVEVGV